MCCALHNVRKRFNEIDQWNLHNIQDEDEDQEGVQVNNEDENNEGNIVRQQLIEEYFTNH